MDVHSLYNPELIIVPVMVRTPYLSKNFRLAGYNATLSFVNDIATIAQQEMVCVLHESCLLF